MNLPFTIAHFIGDFLLQNDWMATGKKRSSWICTLHVALYMLPFLFCGLDWQQLTLIAVQHWIQDRTKFVAWYCRTLGIFQTELRHQALKGNNLFERVLPWGHFVVDQVFHFIWMWVVIYCFW